MSFTDSKARTPRPSALAAVARLIQFRSEVAIIAVLAGAVLLGAVVREVLPVSRTAAAEIADPLQHRAVTNRSPDGARLPRDSASHVVRP